MHTLNVITQCMAIIFQCLGKQLKSKTRLSKITCHSSADIITCRQPFINMNIFRVTVGILLLNLVLSATISLDKASAKTNRDEIYLKNGYKDIPTQDIQDPYLFIHEAVVFTFPQLEQWTLGGIKTKLQLSTSRTIYLYIYDELVEDENSTEQNGTKINRTQTVVVLGNKEGNSFTVYENNKAVRNYDLAGMIYFDYKTRARGDGPRMPTPDPIPEPTPAPLTPATTTNPTTVPLPSSSSQTSKALSFLISKMPQIQNYLLANTEKTTQEKGDIHICFTFQISLTDSLRNYQKHCVIVHPDNTMELAVKQKSQASILSSPALP